MEQNWKEITFSKLDTITSNDITGRTYKYLHGFYGSPLLFLREGSIKSQPDKRTYKHKTDWRKYNFSVLTDGGSLTVRRLGTE